MSNVHLIHVDHAMTGETGEGRILIVIPSDLIDRVTIVQGQARSAAEVFGMAAPATAALPAPAAAAAPGVSPIDAMSDWVRKHVRGLRRGATITEIRNAIPAEITRLYSSEASARGGVVAAVRKAVKEGALEVDDETAIDKDTHVRKAAPKVADSDAAPVAPVADAGNPQGDSAPAPDASVDTDAGDSDAGQVADAGTVLDAGDLDALDGSAADAADEDDDDEGNGVVRAGSPAADSDAFPTD